MKLLFGLENDSRMRLVASAFSLVWLWPVVAGAQVDDPTIAFCNGCSSGFQYADAASQAAQFEFAGGWIVETDDVYVVNVPARTALAYRVTRTRVDPDPFIIGDEFLELDVAPIPGDPGFLDDLAVAVDIAGNLRDAFTQDLPADELELPIELDSAFDLVGPDDGAAGLSRLQFENALTEYYREFWQQQMLNVRETVARALERVLPEGDINLNGVVEVVFDDGTRVKVVVVSMDQDISDPTEVVIEFEIDQESVSAPGEPDMLGVPQQIGHLDDYNVSSDDPNLAAELQELLQRLGAQLVFIGGGSSAGSCTTTMSCSEDGNTIVCSVTYSC